MEPIFKKSWLEAIAYLPESVRNRIVLNVMLFQLSGTLPEKMSSTVRCAMRFILAELGTDLSTLADTSLFPPKKDTMPQKEESQEPEPLSLPAPVPQPEPDDYQPTEYLYTRASLEQRNSIRIGVNAFHKFRVHCTKNVNAGAVYSRGNFVHV